MFVKLSLKVGSRAMERIFEQDLESEGDYQKAVFLMRRAMRKALETKTKLVLELWEDAELNINQKGGENEQSEIAIAK